MATTTSGYLQTGASNTDDTTLATNASTDGDSLGAWLAGTLLLAFAQSSGSAADIKLRIEVSPDGSEWFYWRTVTKLDAASGTTYSRTVPLGSNGEVGDRGFAEFVRVTNDGSVDIDLTARYNTIE